AGTGALLAIVAHAGTPPRLPSWPRPWRSSASGWAPPSGPCTTSASARRAPWPSRCCRASLRPTPVTDLGYRAWVPADYGKIREENVARYGWDTAVLDLLGQLYSERTHFIFE